MKLTNSFEDHDVFLGNFLLQRTLVLSTDELFEAIIKQMNALGLLKQAWINNKGGVLARFAERASSLSEEKQLTVVENLKAAVCIEQTNLAQGLLLESGKFLLVLLYYKLSDRLCRFLSSKVLIFIYQVPVLNF